MKTYFILIFAALGLLLNSCGSTNPATAETVNQTLNSGEFTFMAKRANPTDMTVINVMNSFPNSSSARMLDLSYGYSISVKNNELSVDLPYFGRMYQPSYDTSKNSFRFTSKDFKINESAGKKGIRIFTIYPADNQNIRQIIIQVYANGNAYAVVDSNDRQLITYDGYITKNDAAK